MPERRWRRSTGSPLLVLWLCQVKSNVPGYYETETIAENIQRPVSVLC
jgi:hypothetical protein